MTTSNLENRSRDHGVQPLDALMETRGLENKDLVTASTEQLTHKQVQKARKGREVTPNIQMKIVRALQAAEPSADVKSEDLFSY